MVDWIQADTQLTHLGMTPEEGFILALFPPKHGEGPGSGCVHLEVRGELDRAWVEQQLQAKPQFSLGFIPNPGGTKNREITACRALFYEDDNQATDLESKKSQWERAGLPRPSLQMWTGGKSVHNYWILDTPCDPATFVRLQKLLFAHVMRCIPEAEIDRSLAKPCQVMRLAGGIHPKTGQVSRVVLATGERFPLERLEALITPEGGAVEGPLSATAVTAPSQTISPKRQGILTSKAREALGHLLPHNPTPTRAQPLPDRDLNPQSYAAFLRGQETYDAEYRPQGVHYSGMAYSDRVRLTAEALRFCPERLEPGSGTYGEAFSILAAVVNEFGAQVAVSIAQEAQWSLEHWDINAQAATIEENTAVRGGGHKRIFHVFDTAEFNGWARPWPVLRELKRGSKCSEDDEILQEFKRQSFAQWAKSAATNLTLESVFHPRIACLLGGRADAFPVAHTAMIAPFMTTMASVLGTRMRVEVKGGWKEPMVFWMGTVAPASSLKTPVANQFLGPLTTLDARDQRDWKEEYRRYKAQPADQRGEPPELPRQRVVNDATLEGLCVLLNRETVPGVVAFHDELSAFVGDMDRYRAGNSDRSHWLQMYSGGAINVIRKGSEPILVPRTAVSVFGSIQQDKLAHLLHGDDATVKSGDGFWARFLWVVPEYVFPEQNLNETEITQELLEMIENLDTGVSRNHVVRMSREAWELFAEVCNEWSAEADTTYASRSAFLGKMRGTLARVAGLLYALDYAAEEPEAPLGNEIPLEVMRRAVILCRYFVCQFDVLVPQVGGSDLPDWVVKIVEFAKKNGTGEVTHRDVLRKRWATGSEEAKRMLQALVEQYGVGTLIRAVRKDQVRWRYTEPVAPGG